MQWVAVPGHHIFNHLQAFEPRRFVPIVPIQGTSDFAHGTRSNDCTPGSLLSGPAFSFGSHRQQVRRLPRPREAICRPMCRAPGDRVLLNAARLHTFIEEMASFSFGEDDDLHDAPEPGLLRLRRWRLPHCYVRWLMREEYLNTTLKS
jgi:hypothetical protein